MSYDLSTVSAATLFQVLEGMKADANGVQAAIKQELHKRLGDETTATAPAKQKSNGQRRGRKKDANAKYSSLKNLILDILSANSFDLGGVVIEVKKRIDAGEYSSSAQSLPAVVSQAINSLKQENQVEQDSTSKKYSKVTVAA